MPKESTNCLFRHSEAEVFNDRAEILCALLAFHIPKVAVEIWCVYICICLGVFFFISWHGSAWNVCLLEREREKDHCVTCVSPQAFTKYLSVAAAHFGYHCTHGCSFVVNAIIRMSSVRSSERKKHHKPIFSPQSQGLEQTGVELVHYCVPSLWRCFNNLKGSLLSRRKMHSSFLVVTHSCVDFCSDTSSAKP